MTEKEARNLYGDEEIRLLRAFRKMTSEQKNQFITDLMHLLHTQEHAHDLQDCNA